MNYLKGKSNAWKDITGNQFEFLSVLGYLGKGKWHCKCECGNIKIVSTAKLNNGHVKSCGCLAKTNAIKHNAIGTREYITWANIKSRCTNPNNNSYHNYGGRGINIDEKWLNSFETFFNDMGLKPSKEYTIERINVNEGYSKENCIWATRKQQANNRRSNYFLTYNKITKTRSEWADFIGVNIRTLASRCRANKPINEILKEYKI